MILNQLNSPALRQLDNITRWDTLVDIWCEVKMLTGCVFYEDEKQLLQAQVLERFMLIHPGFMAMTKKEILHAFYMNSGNLLDQTYRHYGRELNGEFVGDVLAAYLRKKTKLHTEKHDQLARALNPPQQLQIPDTTAEEWEAMIQADYQLYQAGKIEMIFNAPGKYWYLRKCKLIEYSSREKWHRWYRDAFDLRRLQAQVKPAYTTGARITKQQSVDMYTAIVESGIVPALEHRSVLATMRRMVYLTWLQILKETAIAQIFMDISYTRPKISNNQ